MNRVGGRDSGGARWGIIISITALFLQMSVWTIPSSANAFNLGSSFKDVQTKSKAQKPKHHFSKDRAKDRNAKVSKESRKHVSKTKNKSLKQIAHTSHSTLLQKYRGHQSHPEKSAIIKQQPDQTNSVDRNATVSQQKINTQTVQNYKYITRSDRGFAEKSKEDDFLTHIHGKLESMYFPSFRDEDHEITEGRAELSYEFDDIHEAMVIQPYHYTSSRSHDDTEPQFTLGDTVLRYQARLSPRWPDDETGVQWKLRTSLTLPTSYTSQNNSVIIRPAIGLELYRGFFNEVLELTYRPYYSFQAAQRSTDIHTGQPLAQHTLGHAFLVHVNPTPWLTFEALTFGSMSWNTQADPVVSSGQSEPLKQGQYTYELSMIFKPIHNIDIGLGYSQKDSLFTDGIYDVTLIDPHMTRYFWYMKLYF